MIIPLISRVVITEKLLHYKASTILPENNTQKLMLYVSDMLKPKLIKATRIESKETNVLNEHQRKVILSPFSETG